MPSSSGISMKFAVTMQLPERTTFVDSAEASAKTALALFAVQVTNEYPTAAVALIALEAPVLTTVVVPAVGDVVPLAAGDISILSWAVDCVASKFAVTVASPVKLTVVFSELVFVIVAFAVADQFRK